MNTAVGLIALLVALGCPDDNLDRAVELLQGKAVPSSARDLVEMVRDVIALVGLET